MQVLCPECGIREQLTQQKWRCSCGAAWDVVDKNILYSEKIIPDLTNIWRYKAWFEFEDIPSPISLGAGSTPLLPAQFADHSLWLKLEYINPTGTFKDRGVELMMNWLKAQGVDRVVEDSSGNAGASVAAYAARLGLRAEIFAPANAPVNKLAQIAVYGAKVRTIKGPRSEAASAALSAVQAGAVYASHAYHPAYLLGQESAAWEIWEQLGRKCPDWCVVPVGQGGLFLGLYFGFQRLLRAKQIKRIPRLVAVQAHSMAPLCLALQKKFAAWPEIQPTTKSIADGIQIAKPVRWRKLLQAIQDSEGLCVQVDEHQIRTSQEILALHGCYVEPTSAVVLAGFNAIKDQIKKNEVVVLVLTGSGLKKPCDVNKNHVH